MRLRYTCLSLALLFSIFSFGQRFDRLDATVSERGQAWALPFTGGLNAPQFSNVDLNNDGIEDLFVFDRAGNVNLTFLSDGEQYTFAPEYAINFPELNNWALLRDYNGDGVMDIFAASSVVGVDGVEAYQGFYEDGKITFTPYSFPADQSFNIAYFPLSTGGRTQVYVSRVDLPSVDDIDCDGDLDIITFNIAGGYAEFFQNQSMEKGYGTDSLVFELQTDCWGGFYESGLSPEIELSPAEGLCSENFNTIEPRHAGSSLLTLDLDGDNDKDLLISDISFDNVGALFNGADCDRAWMNEQEVYFPHYDTPAEVALFSASFYADVDHDGIKDLVVAPNDLNNANGREIVWFYKNTGSNDMPQFNLRQKNYLIDNMIELGSGANPTFVDYNADGLLDIVVGNIGFALPFGERDARLALFENIGTQSEPAFELIDQDYLEFSQFNGQAWNYDPAFGDMDGDGDLDLVVGSEFGTTFYAENIAGVGLPLKFGNITPNWQSLNPGQATTPFIMDVNEDGLNDIFFGERNGNINYFQNIGTATAPMFNSDPNASVNEAIVGRIDTRQFGYVTGYAAPTIVDVEGDLKLITGTENGRIEQYAMTANNLDSEFILESEDFGRIREGIHTRLAIADINSDGFYDALVGNIRGGLSLYTTDLPSGQMVNTNEIGQTKIKIFPNPAKNWLSIHIEQANDFERVQLLDINGRVLQTQLINSTSQQVRLTQLPSGLYFVQLLGEAGTITRKIVVE